MGGISALTSACCSSVRSCHPARSASGFSGLYVDLRILAILWKNGTSLYHVVISLSSRVVTDPIRSSPLGILSPDCLHLLAPDLAGSMQYVVPPPADMVCVVCGVVWWRLV